MTQQEIKDEIITINHYLLQAIDDNNIYDIQKYKILLDNLIDILLNGKL